MIIQLAWARSIHKSQGFTAGPGKDIPFYLLDIGGVELDAGLTYVGASRATTPSAYVVAVADPSGALVFPTWERFERIGAKERDNKKKAIDLALRHKECARLDRLALDFRAANQPLYDFCVRES